MIVPQFAKEANYLIIISICEQQSCKSQVKELLVNKIRLLESKDIFCGVIVYWQI